jgi:hypothetical protein
VISGGTIYIYCMVGETAIARGCTGIEFTSPQTSPPQDGDTGFERKTGFRSRFRRCVPSWLEEDRGGDDVRADDGPGVN